jgi:undecaprenyl-diphosphatase
MRYEAMTDLRWTPAVNVLKVLSALVSTAIDWPIRLLATMLIIGRRHWLALASWRVTVAPSQLCIGSIKSILDRGPGRPRFTEPAQARR